MARRSKQQAGLFNIDFDTGVDNMDDDNDSDLEAELMALQNEGGVAPKRQKKKPVPQENFDAMVAESLKDIPSDDDVSVDENDPDLLSELNEIAGEDEEVVESLPPEKSESPPLSVQGGGDMNLLEERLKMYELAEKNAKEAGETSRARRIGRGKNTLKDLIKQVKQGKTIDPSEIPPEVKTTVNKPTPVSEQSSQLVTTVVADDVNPEPIVTEDKIPEEPATSSENTNLLPDLKLLNLLNERHKQYKIAALKAKTDGDSQRAITYLKVCKQFEHVIEAVKTGQPVDISKMPGPPPESHEKIETQKIQTHSEPTEPIKPKTEDSPSGGSSVGEILSQCLDFYKKQVEKAQSEDNSSKARRMGRIVKQFEQAIKLNRAGKPIPADELPIPPGIPPLPTAAPAPAPTPPPRAATAPKAPPVASPDPSPSPTPSSRSSGSVDSKGGTSKNQTTRISGNHVPNTRAEKQMMLLQARQKQFKEAALMAKRKGEINQAKEFLRTAKGFDKLIDASSMGLPVDFATLPVPPDAKSQLDKEFEMVAADDINEGESDESDILSRLESQLNKQLKMCLTTRDHHKALGDVAGTNRFERLALNVTKDLDVVRLAKKKGDLGLIPKFHYEFKDFSIVKSFTELGENDVELGILRGISYTTDAPKDIDTYIKYTFPYPQDTPVSGCTSTVKNTNNPEYDATYTFPIQRSSRSCQRIFKRQAIKLEVYSKGGFFRSDTLLGTVTVKLLPLETQCEIHDSFDLMDGRKKTGGKLEVRVRVRHPIVTEEVERLHEKWLIIDS